MEPERKRKEVEEQSQGWQNRAVWGFRGCDWWRAV